MGRLNRPAQPGYTYRSPSQTNARDLTPNLEEDVIASQQADNERIRRGLSADARREYNRRLQQEAGGRAMLRTVGRAGLQGGALEAGYQAGRALDEQTGAGKKLVESTGLGRMAEKAAKPKEKVELSEYAKRRMAEEDTDRIMREIDADAAEKKAYSGKDKEEKYRGDDYKRGGSVKGWGKARGARKAKVY